MRWLEIDKYHMKSGDYIIAIYHGYTKRYGLSKDNKNLGYFDDIDEAKKYAETLLTTV